jgi:phage repressor protein C with HTH and peptisase S24 domain
MATAFKQPAPLPYIDPVDMPDLYAIHGVGNCMVPLYQDGALLVGDKREQPEPGEVVLIHFTRAAARRYGVPGWVKRLVHVWPIEGQETLFTVEQLNPPRRYIVAQGDVAAMHKVVGTAKSTGTGTAEFRIPAREARP